MSRPLSLNRTSRPVPVSRTKYVRNDVAGSHGGIACLHPERDLHVRLAFRIGVVFGVFAQPLVDDELVKLDLPAAHIVADRDEILVYALDDDLRRLARQDLVQHVLRDRLGQRAVLAALHVEALDLRRGPEAILDLDRGILFLLEQEQPLEDTVEVDFEKLVAIVDGLFQLRRDFQSLRKLRDVGIDEDGVGVPVDDLRPDQQLQGKAER